MRTLRRDVVLAVVLALSLGLVGAPDARTERALAKPALGALEICLVAGGVVSAHATFTVADHTISVRSGECSVLLLPVGLAVITEHASLGPPLTDIIVAPRHRLVSRDLSARTATVRVVAEGNGKPTTATFAHCLACVSPGATTRVVTLADNRQTVELHVGDRLLLDLDRGLVWTVTVADTSILQPSGDGPDGGQGSYTARAPGHTTLTARGDPPCAPRCLAPTLLFQLTVVVHAAAA